MGEIDFDALEGELSRVSDRLAGERDWEALRPGVRRAMRRPYLRLLWDLGIVGGLLGVGLVFGSIAGVVIGVWVGLNTLPDQVRAVRRRERLLVERGHDLFLDYAKECRKRLMREFVWVLLSVPVAAGALIAGLVLEDGVWAFAVAGLLVLALPYRALVRIPRLAREVEEANEWAGDLEEDEEEDDDDEEGLWWGLITGSFWVFVIYIGPLVAIGMLALVIAGDDWTKPAAVIGVLAALWLYARFFVMHDDDGESS